MQLILYTRYQNSAGERVRIALHLKGVPFEYVPIKSIGPQSYRDLNPQGLMPALAAGGQVIAQSTAILEYLEETYPTPPLLPANLIERAEVRSFAQLITADIHPLNNNRVRKFLEDELDASYAQVMHWYHHWIATGFASLEASLARRRTQSAFCFGAEPGWADLHLAPQVFNARRFDCDLSPYPLLCGVDENCRAHPAFIAAAPENQPDHPGNI